MEDNPRRQALLSLLPLFFTSILIMGPYIANPLGIGWPETLRPDEYPLNSALLQLTFFLLQLFINRDCVLSGLKAVSNRHPNMDTLILLGVMGSLGMALCSIDTVGKGSTYPLTLELYIFNGIALLTVNAFSDCAAKEQPPLPQETDTLLHISIWYVPAIIISGIIATIWTAVTGEFNINCLFLIMLSGCPAAIKLVYPLLLLRLYHLCEKNGIVIQKPEALVLLPEMDVLAVPFSGIITTGEGNIRDSVSQGIMIDKTITMAATAESEMDASPIAMAIVREARKRKLVLGKTSGVNVIAGMGVEAMVNHMLVRVGNASLLRSQRIKINAEMSTKADQFAGRGLISVFVNSGYYVRGVLGIEEPINVDAEVGIKSLDDMSVSTLLLTGKDKTTLKYYAKEMEIHQAIGNLTPADKAKEIQIRRVQGQTVAAFGMSPSFKDALEAADISIVPRSAPEELRENAHLIVNNRDIRSVSQAVSMGLSWQQKLKHCIAVSFLMNIFMLALSAVIIFQGAADNYHPLIPLMSTVITILGLVLCTSTLSAD